MTALEENQSTGVASVNYDAMALIAARTIDEIESAMAMLPPCNAPVVHRFTPGLYVREIFMPRGSLITSKIHKHQHPFAVLKGRCSVYTKSQGWMDVSAPYIGITEPGTRRILLIHEDTMWATFHVTNETDLEKIEEHVIAKTEEACAAFISEQSKMKLQESPP